MKHRATIILLFFTILMNTPCVFSQVIILDDDHQEISSLGGSVSYFIDSENKNYDIEAINDANIKWQKSTSNHLNLGFLPHSVWLKIEILNKSSVENWYLVLDNPIVDVLNYYQKTKDSVIRHPQVGWQKPYHERGKLKHRGFAFPLKIASNEKQTCYFRIYSKSPNLFNISILTESKTYQKSMNQHIGYGIYFGILIVMILYNLIIFLITKDTNYFYYVLTMICTLTTFASISGYLFKYIYPDFPELNIYFTLTPITGIIITTSIFTIHFLSLKKQHLWLYYYFLLMIVFAVLGALYDVLFGTIGIDTVTKLQSVSLIATGIYCWYKGSKYARFFVLAWSAYIIGGLMITFRNSGVLPIHFLTNYGVYIGSAIETILISIALADKYKIIRKEKDLAVERAFVLERQTQAELEKKVDERTKQLREKNEEVNQQNEELTSMTNQLRNKNILVIQQNEELNHQKSLIEHTHKKITTSINYGKRIQAAILPSKDLINTLIPKCFIFFRPRDVVSGDFYWCSKIRNANNQEKVIFATVDCTGHGVPGAFMSMIGANLLAQIVSTQKISDPAHILNLLHKGVMQLLQQDQNQNRDGMDAAISVIDWNHKKLSYAGAKRPLCYVQNQEMCYIKGDIFPVGGYMRNVIRKFTTHNVCFAEKPIMAYTFSDGYADQIGGIKSRKFMVKRFRKLLMSISQKSIRAQKQQLGITLDQWKNRNHQLDDILVVGMYLE